MVIILTDNSNIRRIDELGRIVIPKDIRKKLHIKNGEPLEIFIDSDYIKIKKYSALPDITKTLEYLIDVGSRITGNKYIITNRDKIIVSSINSDKNILINETLENLLFEAKDEKNILIELSLNSISTTVHANILPIILDNDRAGLIIEYNESIDLKDNNIIRLFKEMIEKQLNNY
jgi:AbrB family transcriptional regulator (stage V sporulation protein T)